MFRRVFETRGIGFQPVRVIPELVADADRQDAYPTFRTGVSEAVMPELPEVETMVRGIRPHVEGRLIAAFRACPCECRPMTVSPPVPTISKRCSGRRIEQVFRRAKRVVLRLDSGEAFVVEPRMTGLMLVSDPPSREHLRFEWEFSDERPINHLWFWDRRGLGTLKLLKAEALDALLGVGVLGRDALEMELEHWIELCASTSTAIKVALLNQQRVAGIGNLYASEILHLAGISPLKPACDLKRGAIENLGQATRQILETAILYEGSTLSDGTYRNALNKAGGYQNAHQVYDREGAPCPRCRRGVVQRLVQAQRSTFFCPRCQK